MFQDTVFLKKSIKNVLTEIEDDPIKQEIVGGELIEALENVLSKDDIRAVRDLFKSFKAQNKKFGISDLIYVADDVDELVRIFSHSEMPLARALKINNSVDLDMLRKLQNDLSDLIDIYQQLEQIDLDCGVTLAVYEENRFGE